MKNRFFKGHGLGNEYIVLDPAELAFTLTPGRIARICDRDMGVGSDGVLTLEDARSADFGARIWNPDGSEAETSGNGLRILACYLHATGRTREPSFTVETPGGAVHVEAQFDSTGAVCAATVHMGRATFSPMALPCTLEVDELIEQPINVDGEALTFTGVSVGNPHCVVFHPQDQRRTGINSGRSDDLRWPRDHQRGRSEELLQQRDGLLWPRDHQRGRSEELLQQRDGLLWSRDDLLRLGPALETHPVFPKRTNVQLAEVSGPDSLRILIWERGAGGTPSSGSSACAAAGAAVRLGLVTSPVTVESTGGALRVDVDEEFNLTLTGPVEEVVQGTFSEAMLREILDAGGQVQTT